jgi:hypothetical protein
MRGGDIETLKFEPVELLIICQYGEINRLVLGDISNWFTILHLNISRRTTYGRANISFPGFLRAVLIAV